MNINEFQNELIKININLSAYQLKQFQQYAEFIIEYNKKINLTSITDIEEIYAKHFYDCLIPFKGLHFKKDNLLADIGSGAGFPGIVLKIAFPELNITLIEPTLKRCIFLNETIALLKLDKIEVLNKRAEDLNNLRGHFDYVTARAVAGLNVLSELCAPLLKVGGHFIILRGKDGLNELKQATTAFNTLNLKQMKVDIINYNDNTRVNSIYRLEKSVSSKYPRNYSIIKRKPL